jgi:hypothetical protein
MKKIKSNAIENETLYVNVVTFAPSQYFIRYLLKSDRFIARVGTINYDVTIKSYVFQFNENRIEHFLGDWTI